MISVQDVHYTYPGKYQKVEALKGVNCEFEQGVLYSIIGKSGSGKSTLLSLLSGLDVPSHGIIEVQKEDISKLDRNRYRREKVAIIYQSLNLFPLLTVLENIMYPMRMNGVQNKEAKQKAYELLNKVDLSQEYAKKLPSMLSGGEQQRVAIARALAMPGNIILADEPTGNLDSQNTQNIIQILSELAHTHQYCVVIVTHDGEIANQSDVVYEIHDGEIVSTQNHMVNQI